MPLAKKVTMDEMLNDKWNNGKEKYKMDEFCMIDGKLHNFGWKAKN